MPLRPGRKWEMEEPGALCLLVIVVLLSKHKGSWEL